MNRKYEFRTASGRMCCSTDNREYLCDKCRKRLKPYPLPQDPYATPATLRAAEREKALDELLADPTVHDLRGRPMSGYDYALALRKAEVQR